MLIWWFSFLSFLVRCAECRSHSHALSRPLRHDGCFLFRRTYAQRRIYMSPPRAQRPQRARGPFAIELGQVFQSSSSQSRLRTYISAFFFYLFNKRLTSNQKSSPYKRPREWTWMVVQCPLLVARLPPIESDVTAYIRAFNLATLPTVGMRELLDGGSPPPQFNVSRQMSFIRLSVSLVLYNCVLYSPGHAVKGERHQPLSDLISNSWDKRYNHVSMGCFIYSYVSLSFFILLLWCSFNAQIIRFTTN